MSKNLNKSVIVNESDIWRPLADFFTDMIAKYAEEMDYDNLPDPDWYLKKRTMTEAYIAYTRKRNRRLEKYVDLEYANLSPSKCG